MLEEDEQKTKDSAALFRKEKTLGSMRRRTIQMQPGVSFSLPRELPRIYRFDLRFSVQGENKENRRCWN